MTFVADLGYAVRSLARSPGLTAMLLITIAAGVGTHAAVDGFVSGLPAELFAVDGATAGAVDPEIGDKMAQMARLLEWSTALVFLTAAANVAGFLLSRAWKRSHETAARIALGATERHLASQVVADSIVISLAGGAFGAMAAFWTARAVPALLFTQDAEQLHFGLSAESITHTAGVYSLVMVGCALAPLLRIRKSGTLAVLRRTDIQTTAPGRERTALVVGQMAVCSVLIIVSAFLVQGFRQSLRTARAEYLGDPIIAIFDERGGYASEERTQAYFRSVDAEARRIAALTTVAWISTPPGVRPVERPARFEAPATGHKDVSIDTLPFPEGRDIGRLTLTQGRSFGGVDSATSCPVAIVNGAAADRYLGGDALGSALEDAAGRRIDVIGVVAGADAREPDGEPLVYLYERQAKEPMSRDPAHRSYRLRITPSVSPPIDVAFNVASVNYFAAMAASVVAGKLFTPVAAPGACDTAVINREGAERYFDHGAIGGAVIDAEGRRAEIVGVVDTGVLRITQRRDAPAIYYPAYERFSARMALIAGTAKASRALLADVDRRLGAVTGGTPPRPAITLDEHLAQTSLGPERIAAVLVTVSTGVALVLAVLGIYGALTDLVIQRKREIALRLALGAQAPAIISDVLRAGLRIAAAGAVVGTAAAWLLIRVLEHTAAGFGASAAWMWLAAPAVLVAIVTAASVLPAKYALAVDPLTLTREG